MSSLHDSVFFGLPWRPARGEAHLSKRSPFVVLSVSTTFHVATRTLLACRFGFIALQSFGLASDAACRPLALISRPGLFSSHRRAERDEGTCHFCSWTASFSQLHYYCYLLAYRAQPLASWKWECVCATAWALRVPASEGRKSQWGQGRARQSEIHESTEW